MKKLLEIKRNGGLLYLEPGKEPIGFAGLHHGDIIPLIPSNDFMESGLFYVYVSALDTMSVVFKPNSTDGFDMLIAGWNFHQLK